MNEQAFSRANGHAHDDRSAKPALPLPHLRRCVAVRGIYFSGSSRVFSASLLTAVAEDVPGLEVMRGRPEVSADLAPAVVVLAPDDADALIDEARRLEADFPDAALVICYETNAEVCGLMRKLREASLVDRVSLLSLDYRIDAFLAILNLAIWGTNYIPAEASPQDERVGNIAAESALAKLTDREIDVLTRVATGARNQTVAFDLGLSEHTVKMYMHRIIRKLGVRNRTEAAKLLSDANGRG